MNLRFVFNVLEAMRKKKKKKKITLSRLLILVIMINDIFLVKHFVEYTCDFEI